MQIGAIIAHSDHSTWEKLHRMRIGRTHRAKHTQQKRKSAPSQGYAPSGAEYRQKLIDAGILHPKQKPTSA